MKFTYSHVEMALSDKQLDSIKDGIKFRFLREKVKIASDQFPHEVQALYRKLTLVEVLKKRHSFVEFLLSRADVAEESFSDRLIELNYLESRIQEVNGQVENIGLFLNPYMEHSRT